MRVYESVKENKAKSAKAESALVFSQKKLRVWGLLLITILSFGVMGLSLSDLNLSKEVRAITSSWSPNVTDLGKLKFVINQNETESEVLAQLYSLSMPFENNYVTEVETGVFMVDGLGGLLVKSCMAGTVTKVEQNGEFKRLTISHGKGLVSVYDYIDNVGVKEGDRVEKNTPLGICYMSRVLFKMMFKNKVLAGLTVKDGELTFM